MVDSLGTLRLIGWKIIINVNQEVHKDLNKY